MNHQSELLYKVLVALESMLSDNPPPGPEDYEDAQELVDAVRQCLRLPVAEH